jgi:hypothetical protein
VRWVRTLFDESGRTRKALPLLMPDRFRLRTHTAAPPGHLFFFSALTSSMNHVQSSFPHIRNPQPQSPCLFRKRDEGRGGHAFGLMLGRNTVWHRMGGRGRSGRDSIASGVHNEKSKLGWSVRRGARRETTGIFRE